MKKDGAAHADFLLTKAHFQMLDDSKPSQNTYKVKCKYCFSEYTAPASRLAYHLAGISGAGVKPCPSAPLEVMEEMKGIVSRKETRTSSTITVDEDDEDVDEPRKKVCPLD